MTDSDNEREPEEVPAEPSTSMERLVCELRDRDSQLNELRVEYRRALDELDRSKERIERESKKLIEKRTRQILSLFLPVIDGLERALEAGTRLPDRGALLEGVALVQASLLENLGAHGVTRMNPLGHPFDPNLHEAVSVIRADSPRKIGIVLAVAESGYLIGDEVLRPATVAVGK
jgi:molecular chaperone GrpE